MAVLPVRRAGRDLVADGVGVAAALALLLLWQRACRRRPPSGAAEPEPVTTTPRTSDRVEASSRVALNSFMSGIVHAFSFFSWLNLTVRTPLALRSVSTSGAFADMWRLTDLSTSCRRRTVARLRCIIACRRSERGWRHRPTSFL